MKKLIFIRGLPGSGKSTKANIIKEYYMYSPVSRECSILTTDDFFIVDGVYKYDISMIGQAHRWNQARFDKKAFDEISVVIVPNTNIQAKQIFPYLNTAKKFGYEISVSYPDTPWKDDPSECYKKTLHNVPLEVIEGMHKKFETDEVFKQNIQNYLDNLGKEML